MGCNEQDILRDVLCGVGAFELRQKGDYMEEAEVTKEDVDDLFPIATDFVNKIKAYLTKNN